MFTFLHTSDWHLGHTLHDVDRGPEHAAFFGWLLGQLDDAVDALVIAGDIFDSANPSIQAQRAWYRFLGAVRDRAPRCLVLAVGGNHDSAGRLDAPAELLAGSRLHIVGGVRRDGELRGHDELLVPVSGRDGAPVAVLAAVPFLRPGEIPAAEGLGPDDDPWAAAVAAFQRSLYEAACQRYPGLPVVMTGHLHLREGRASEDSERRLVVGAQGALPHDIYPEGVDYVALGHLHLAQSIGNDRVQYSGSPIPLSLTERTYRHQILRVQLHHGIRVVKSIEIPRSVGFFRIPEDGQLSPEGALLAARAFVPPPNCGVPFVEVAVRLSGPRPALRRELDQALEGKGVRLARVSVVSEEEAGIFEGRPGLEATSPEEVFRELHRRRYKAEPDDDLLGTFRELLASIGEAP
jgi:exonuclease SbcD